jgi:hypothetical protein
MPAHSLLVRGAGCRLCRQFGVQFQPASLIPDLLAYGGGGGLAEWDVLVDRVDAEQASLPVRRGIELAHQPAAVQDRQMRSTHRRLAAGLDISS